MQTTQPSTVRNLVAITGDAHTALAYGKDIADLLSGDGTVRPDEADLLAAAVAVALGIAAREVSSAYPEARTSVTTTSLRTAARTAAAGLDALRGDDDVAGLTPGILDAMVFQLTDLDEQD